MAKAQKVQYPNPKFFKAKDNIEWKKQGENLKEVMGIFGKMLAGTDWKAFGEGMVDILRGIFAATVANGFLLAVLIYQVAKMRKPENPSEIESAD